MKTCRYWAGGKSVAGFAITILAIVAMLAATGSQSVAADEINGGEVPASDAVQFTYAKGVKQDPGLNTAVLDIVNARSTMLRAQSGDSKVQRLDSLAARGQSVQARVDRENGSWAQGVAYVVAPEIEGAMPEGWVFIAEHVENGWNAYLEGDPGFVAAAVEADTTTSEERSVYAVSSLYLEAPRTDVARYSRVVSNNTEMQFPVKAGSWFYTNSPHGHTGYFGPLSSIDISGSDGTVRSARGGYAINMCDGWTRIIHNNGYSTDYYHIAASRQLTGYIGQNIVLGYQGTTTCAGGMAYGSHVHFSLREYDSNNNGRYVSLNNKIIGNHRIYTGGYYTGGSTVDILYGNWGNLPGYRWNY